MSNTNSSRGSSFLKKYLAVCLVLDVIWAALIATFGATILHAIGIGAGADAGVTTTASVLGWIIAFVFGFLQGGIFLLVFSLIGFIALAFFGSGRSKSGGGNGGGNSGSGGGDIGGDFDGDGDGD